MDCSPVAFRRLTIASKLYAIFALLATVTVAIVIVAVINARRHAALTDEFRASYDGARQLERINSIIHAVGMEARGLLLVPDPTAAGAAAAKMIAFNYRLGDAVTELQWQINPEDQKTFEAFASRIKDFQELQRNIARRGAADPAALRQSGAGETGHAALTRDIEALGQAYAQRSKQLYAQIEQAAYHAAWLLTGLAGLLLLLAAAGTIIIRRSCIRPLTALAQVTEKVADGQLDVTIPYRGRGDEIGALATSIAIFHAAMRHNAQLSNAVRDDADARRRRQESIDAEIARFSTDADGTLKEFIKMSHRAKTAATELAKAVDITLDRTGRATDASSESSANVRDIASAAEELAMSVMEIERQVSQSNEIAMKAVGEAEATNRTVNELNEAASRIGDVIRMINEIAEQTNLLALNATIEAARAGDAGRGFAVVAGEVKALAGQTAKATEDIGIQISSMQQATDRSIAAIGDIKRTIRDIGEISSAIAAAVTEQGAATQEIARSVETASRRSADTADQIGWVSEATGISRTHADAAQVVSDRLDQLASRMRRQMDEFFERLRVA